MRNTRGTRGARALAEFLEDQRVARGWSKAQLAREIGVDRTTLFRWLRASNQIQHEHARQISDALGVDYDEVLALAGIRSDAAAPADDVPPIELYDNAEREIWGMKYLEPKRKIELIIQYRGVLQAEEARRRMNDRDVG